MSLVSKCIVGLLASVSLAAADRPNVVLIMADDVGVECFTPYGGESVVNGKVLSTPWLVQLAAEGLQFNHCHSLPVCTPTRVAIMTGRSNVRNYSEFRVLQPDQQTFGHGFQAAGYATAIAGKWQLYGSTSTGHPTYRTGMLPENAGFDEHCLWQVDQLGDRYWNPLIRRNGEIVPTTSADYGPDIFSDYLLDFIDRKHAAGERFFAYYPMALPHDPFVRTPDSPSGSQSDPQEFSDMVAYTDKILGKFMDKLDALGIRDETLLIFTADNGTNRGITTLQNGARVPGGKAGTLDSGTHVPMVASWAGVTPAGAENGDVIGLVDVFATLMDAIGEPVPGDTDGRSFLPQLRGRRGEPREFLYTYYYRRLQASDSPVAWVRDQQWKLYADGRFFNTQRDPFESNDLSSGTAGVLGEQAREKLIRGLATMPLVSEEAHIAAELGPTRPATDRPNLVLLVCDDAGWGDFGFSGHPTIRTPRLDMVRRQGRLFSQFHAAAPVGSLSRYGLHTGRHPLRSGLAGELNPGTGRFLHVDEAPLAESLAGRGYATGMLGSWLLGFPNPQNGADAEALPLAHGFDEWFGLPYGHEFVPPDWPPLPLLEGPDGSAGNAIPGYRTVATDPDLAGHSAELEARAVQFIRDHRDGPFFLNVNFSMPRRPLHPGGGTSRRGRYGNAIEEVDAAVGGVLHALRAEGIAHNTLVLFLSDNGPNLAAGTDGGSAGGLRDGMGSTWEGGIRVPAVAWWPGSVPAGSTVRAPVSILDVPVSAVLLAGAAVPADRTIDGRDIRPLLLGTGSLPAEPMFFSHDAAHVTAVRKGKWKLHVSVTSPTGIGHGFGAVTREQPLLFDLERDPFEKFDRAEDEPGVVDDLLGELDAFEAQVAGEGSFWDSP